MTQNLKSLSLTLVVVLALSAMTASSASALSGFTSSSLATITGTQSAGLITGKTISQHEISTRVGVVKCNSAAFHGVALFAETSAQTLTPTYQECKLSGFIPVTITMGSCDYLITAGTTVGGSSNTIQAALDIQCFNTGEKIVIEATKFIECSITIPPQNSFISAMDLSNGGGSGASMTVLAVIDAAGLKYEVHGSQCPNQPVQTALYSDGTYKGLISLQSNGVNGITVH